MGTKVFFVFIDHIWHYKSWNQYYMAQKIRFNEESKTTAYEKEIIMSCRCGTTCKKKTNNPTILSFDAFGSRLFPKTEYFITTHGSNNSLLLRNYRVLFCHLFQQIIYMLPFNIKYILQCMVIAFAFNAKSFAIGILVFFFLSRHFFCTDGRKRFLVKVL